MTGTVVLEAMLIADRNFEVDSKREILLVKAAEKEIRWLVDNARNRC